MARVDSVSSKDTAQEIPHDVAVSDAHKPVALRHAQLARNAAVMSAASGTGSASLIGAIMQGVVIPRQNAETMYKEQHVGRSIPREQSDGTNKTINQFAYTGDRLGGGGRPLSQAGCALSAMTMGSNRVTGSNRSLAQANEQLTNSGALAHSGGINFSSAATQLGVTQLSRRAATDANIEDAQDQLRRDGRFLVVGVDYKPNTRGQQSSVASGVDHYIMLDKVNADGTMSGIDSAGGDPVTFARVNGQWRSVDASKDYKIREVGVYAARDSVPRSPTIQRKA